MKIKSMMCKLIVTSVLMTNPMLSNLQFISTQANEKLLSYTIDHKLMSGENKANIQLRFLKNDLYSLVSVELPDNSFISYEELEAKGGILNFVVNNNGKVVFKVYYHKVMEADENAENEKQVHEEEITYFVRDIKQDDIETDKKEVVQNEQTQSTLTETKEIQVIQDGKTNVMIDEMNFPDVNFRKYIADNIDKNQDGILSLNERRVVTKISVDNQGIQSLKGIEHFPNLYTLEASSITESNKNQIQVLDVSQNTELGVLAVDGNVLSNLDLSNNPKLDTLKVAYNNFTTLDVSQNPLLRILHCNDNQLTSLDVSNNPKLAQLWCSTNNLTDLDVTKNAELWELVAYKNRLTSLDLTNNADLTYLRLNDNMLSQLDVTKNPKLIWITIGNNQFTEVDFTKNTKLRQIHAQGNQLKNIDVSQNKELVLLYLDNNQIEEINILNNIQLKALSLYSNRLSSLNVSKNVKLEKLYIYDNQISEIDVSNNVALTAFWYSTNHITYVDLSNNHLIQDLDYYAHSQTRKIPLTFNPVTRNYESVDMLTFDNPVFLDKNVSYNVSTKKLEMKRYVQSTYFEGKTNSVDSRIVTGVLTFEYDNVKPEIFASDKIINVGDEYDLMQDVVATDFEDGDISDKVTASVKKKSPSRSDVINMHEKGEYEITYQVLDSFGAISEKTVLLKIIDTEQTPDTEENITDKGDNISNSTSPSVNNINTPNTGVSFNNRNMFIVLLLSGLYLFNMRKFKRIN